MQLLSVNFYFPSLLSFSLVVDVVVVVVDDVLFRLAYKKG
jgi:hypothetical protein